ncbi:MAG: efflux RND transporter permease subunit [Deltaproteobacteria bacterium]|nr:efflux RND transporter permease subunit [Deltaproteobacteria bacterium]
MVEWLVKKALVFRIPLLLGILVLTILATSTFFRNLGRADNALPVWFEKGDPAYAAYEDFMRTFGNDRFIVLGFEVPEVFSPDVLTFLSQITSALLAIPDVEKVTSITNVEFIEGGQNEVTIRPFVETIPQNLDELKRLKETALSRPEFVGSLVSADSKIAGIIARINTPHTMEANSLLKERVLNAVSPLNTNGYPFHLSGSPITDETFNRLILKDQRLFAPAVLLLSWLLISLFFRNFLIALVPVAIQLPVIASVLALYYSLGYKMNAVGGMLVPILVAVCIADSVHLVLEYRSLREKGVPKNEALVAAPKKLWRPCLFTAVTTLAGFISFQSSSIEPINVLGTLTAVGVLIALLLTIFFLPVVLSFFPENKPHKIPPRISPRLTEWLDIASNLTEQKPAWVAGIFILLTLISIYGVSRIKIESNFMEYFSPENPTRKDLEFFNQKLAGVGSYEMVFSSDDAIAENPEVLKKVELFRQTASLNPITREIRSPTDPLKRLNEAFHGSDAAFYRLPDTREETAQLYLLAAGSGETEIDSYKTLDNTKIRLSLMTQWISSEKLGEYLDELKKNAEEIFSPLGVSVLLTGFGPLWVEVDRRILSSQITSFLIAFILVSILMGLFLKSARAGMISMIPNLLPILFAMGFMGFAGIPLSVSTVMIAGVTIGITVDDTIHYLARYRHYLKSGMPPAKAHRRTNGEIGRAIVFTSSILMAGFGVLLLGSMKPSVYFGGIVALTLFLAIFCEIFLTPLLLKWWKPFNES